MVTAIFENRAEFLEETVEIVGDQMTGQEFAQIRSGSLRCFGSKMGVPNIKDRSRLGLACNSQNAKQ